MAKFAISLLLLFSCSMFAAMPGGASAGKTLSHNICEGKENLTKLHFFVQDVVSGPNQTVYTVANASITSNSSSFFGLVRVMDELLTAGPDNTTEVVGRMQGLVTSADLAEMAFTMNINFVFTSGEYNGSTICILGRNPILNDVREVAVVGGTGVFRFARGYAITTSYSSQATYGVIEYTLCVIT